MYIFLSVITRIKEKCTVLYSVSELALYCIVGQVFSPHKIAGFKKATTECRCGATEYCAKSCTLERLCRVTVLTIEHMCTANPPWLKENTAWFCCVQSDQALNRKYHRADCVNLVLITPTHISDWVPKVHHLESH